MILCELTRSRESGADEEQGAQVAEHDDVCPVGDERDNREARREWPTLAVRLAGRKFLIRTPEIPHFRIVPEISGVYLLKLRLQFLIQVMVPETLHVASTISGKAQQGVKYTLTKTRQHHSHQKG